MPVKLLRDTWVTCKRNKSLILSDQTIQAEGLGDFLNIQEKLLSVSERKSLKILEEHSK